MFDKRLILYAFAEQQLLFVPGRREVSKCFFVVVHLSNPKTSGRSARGGTWQGGGAWQDKTQTDWFAKEARDLRIPRGMEHTCPERTFRSTNRRNPFDTVEEICVESKPRTHHGWVRSDSAWRGCSAGRSEPREMGRRRVCSHKTQPSLVLSWASRTLVFIIGSTSKVKFM